MYILNPLDQFQSYSVHYIMLVTRTTVGASEFAKEDNNTATLAAIDNVKALGDPIIFGDTSDVAYLVIDTRRFGQFTIENLKYDVYVNGLQKQSSTANLAADLSMTVLDSVGISFANFLQWLMDEQMQTNYDGLVFMLRTIFVGHKEDGTSETVQSETIPMHLNRVEINLNFAKGAYTMEFIPNMNFDVKKYSRFMTISTATTYSTGPGNTLRGLIGGFEERLNTKSREYFNSVQQKIGAAGGKGQFGRRVDYQITIPEAWNEFKLQGSSPGGKTETKFTEGQATEPPATIKDSLVSTKPGSEITKILDEIFRQIPDIAEMGNFKSTDASKDGFITFYKYVVGLTSSLESMCVHVDVVEFKVPNVFRRKESDEGAIAGGDSEFYKEAAPDPLRPSVTRREPKDFLEYDFIYTGVNKDILEFEMKIQDFQFLLASNLKIGSGEMDSASDSTSSPEKSNDASATDLLYARKYDPIVIPADSASALQNFSNVAGAIGNKPEDITRKQQQYTKNLSMFYAGSPIITTMMIKGNPLIMHKFNMGKLLGHTTASGGAGGPSGVVLSREAYRKDLEDRILKQNPNLEKRGNSFSPKSNLSEKSYAVSPVFVRVKVKGPAVDFRTNEENSPPYGSSVLEDMYYVLFKLTNTIQGHMFTQELELYAHNIFGASGTDKLKTK